MELLANGAIKLNSTTEKRTPVAIPTLDEIRVGWNRIAKSDMAHIRSLPKNLEELGSKKSSTLAKKPIQVFDYRI